MGAVVPCSPRPRPGGSGGSIATRRSAPSARGRAPRRRSMRSSATKAVQDLVPGADRPPRCAPSWSISGSSSRAQRVASRWRCRHGRERSVPACSWRSPSSRPRFSRYSERSFPDGSGPRTARSRRSHDPKTIAHPDVGARPELEHVTAASSRQGQPTRRQDPDVGHAERSIEPRDRDRERHPERVDRRAPFEEDRSSGSEAGPSAEAARAFPARRRGLALEPEPAIADEEHSAHVRGRYGPLPTGAGGPGRIRTRDTRVKSPLL